ncbi:group 1 truncated hemoglobin [Embleya sp. NBC_00896]|uniref:group I truncated hemoglobin n=1 Tax=Embleya sp. NBC_00896 TaxID=2975961 RepID=UPI002F91A9D6|nr:group 1 truncated hemoglobin [Embleya sp. NBC_00896]
MSETNASTSEAISEQTMYEQLGGGPVIREAVDRFYRLVLADPELAPYFERSDVSAVKRHQALLLASVLGGPETYDGRTLAAAHTGLGVTGPHYDKVSAYLLDVLGEMGAPTHIADAVASTLKAVRDDIVQDDGAVAEGVR